MKTDWQNKPVTILGLSKSGMACAEYLAHRGAKCFLSETVPATPANLASREKMQALGVEYEMGGHTHRCFEHSDLVIASPGIPPHSQIMKELALSGKEIISEIELAYRESDTPWVGITGTNGKTTTTTLTSKILEAAGKKSPACGNIGIPIISLVEGRNDYFVAELSSFQLNFSPTLKTKIAMFLNFKPDHLDWHGSEEAYKQAKFLLFEGVHTPEWAVLNASDPICREIGNQTKAKVLWFSRDQKEVADKPHKIYLDAKGNVVIEANGKPAETLLDTAKLKLVGKHNHENVLAAAAATWLLDVPKATIESASLAFEGVEHRLEPVSTINNITYYNDSKATNPDASISALEAFAPRKVVLIAGGKDKKTSLDEFVASVKNHADYVILIGEATDRFALELKAGGYNKVETASSLEDAVQKATAYANEKTPVLFSPACASFDMFKNFEERGQAFKEAVHRLLTVPA